MILVYETNVGSIVISGSSNSDKELKEVDAITPEKSAAMRGSTIAPSSTLVPPSGAAPTITMPERKRKRKGIYFIINKFLQIFTHHLYDCFYFLMT